MNDKLMFLLGVFVGCLIFDIIRIISRFSNSETTEGNTTDEEDGNYLGNLTPQLLNEAKNVIIDMAKAFIMLEEEDEKDAAGKDKMKAVIGYVSNFIKYTSPVFDNFDDNDIEAIIQLVYNSIYEAEIKPIRERNKNKSKTIDVKDNKPE